jgi:hypothetical protein
MSFTPFATAAASAANSPAGEPAAPPPVESLRDLLGRLHAVLREEHECLRRNDLSMLEEHARQKDMLLLDISRFIPRAQALPELQSLLARELEDLHAALEENREALARQLAAARDFSAFLEDCIRRHASDGTYSRRRRRYGEV